MPLARRDGIEGPFAVALTMVLAVFFAFVTTRVPVGDGQRTVGALALLLVAGTVLALGATLRLPLSGALVVAVALGCYLARGYPNGPVLAAGILAVFQVARVAGRRSAVIAFAAMDVAVLCGWEIAGDGSRNGLLYVGWSAAAAFLGDALRSRRGYRREQLARAESVERGREAEALRRVAEQRLRIARDLHDGVAHAMATINVQAAAAARVLDRRPAAAKEALTAIAHASATVLDELNAVVAVLRERGEAPDRAPTPGLAGVAALVEASTGGSLECSLEVRGDVTATSHAVGTAAYRIVQESLTNVIRHAHASRAVVSVVASPGGRLAVQVCDDGTGGPAAGTTSASPGGGTGIVGMRERAESTGGRLTAGATATGFTVRAEWGTGA